MAEDDRFLDEPVQPPSVFIGREPQLEWLGRLFFSQRRLSVPFIILGPPGSGKSTFVRQFMSTYRIGVHPLWLRVQPDVDETLRELSDHLRSFGDSGRSHVVIFDDAEVASDEQAKRLFSGAVDWKTVRAVLFTSRRPLPFENAPTMTLSGFSASESRNFFKQVLSYELTEQQLVAAEHVIRGNPAAGWMLVRLLEAAGPDALNRVLAGRVYDLSETVAESDVPKIIVPKIVTANELLIERLKAQPSSIYELPPRKFEELVADLLEDMGVEVHLTPQTCDGGRDILANIHTGLGKMLCLVEAKRYRQDRKVGVDLVRTLYGTLCDANANSAMLVTTSSFTGGAQAFAGKHEWRLQLRDYGNLVTWIESYKTGPRSPFAQ